MTARRPRIRAALLALLMPAGLAVAGCSSSGTSAPSMADVAALLARHGKAVLDHDQKAFVADLDPATKAESFRDDQEGSFANLVKLPLTSWSYRISGRTDDRESEAAETKRFGTKAIIVRLTLRYALRGVDPTPTDHDLWWTFVRHDGRVVVAADDGLAQAGGVSWQGPWDFGPLDVVRGTHSLVLGHPDHAAVFATIAADVAAAVPAVSAVWGEGWSRDIAVVVPSSPDELAAQVGGTSDITTDIAAVATADGQDPVSGAVYGQRLIVNPDALARLSAIGRQITFRHEITHIADARATTDASPRWLIEGFADYVGNLGSGQPVTTTAAELRADIRRGRLPKALPSEASFDTQGQAAQAYEQAWLACRLIAARAGQPGLVRFYRLVGASAEDADGAVAAALQAVLHESTAQFTAQWRTYLHDQLG